MLFDYSDVTADSIRLTVDAAIAEAEAIVNRVVDGDHDTFDRVMAPLEDAGDIMARTYGTTAFLGYVHPDSRIRAVGKEVEERISKWGVDLAFRDDLYAAVKAYSESPDAVGLTADRARLLRFTLRDFARRVTNSPLKPGPG